MHCPCCKEVLNEDQILKLIDPKKIKSLAAAMAGAAGKDLPRLATQPRWLQRPVNAGTTTEGPRNRLPANDQRRGEGGAVNQSFRVPIVIGALLIWSVRYILLVLIGGLIGYLVPKLRYILRYKEHLNT
jgi:hypothetical protein